MVPPEVNIARRLISLKKLSPPVDVRLLVAEFADLREMEFPYAFDIDGVCLGLKRPGRKPTVVLNSRRSGVRQRFTLAHELGHILIPWHTGNVFDFTSGDIFDEEFEYRTMEAEANRFASELLMPTDWVTSLVEDSPNPVDLVRRVSREAQTSPPAALLKLVSCLPPGFVFIEVSEGEVVRTGQSPNTVSNIPHPIDIGSIDGIFPWARARWSGSTSTGVVHWWDSNISTDVKEGVGLSWRDILLEIVSETSAIQDAKKFGQSLSGVVGATNGSLRGRGGVVALKNLCLQRIYSRAQESEEYREFIGHPRFEDFLDAKLIEVMKKW